MWHGSIADLQANLTDSVARYDKPVLLAELSYPWTYEDGDGRGLGFLAWEPQWVPGVGWEPGAEAPNDNLTQFDFTGRALPSIRAYRR